MASTPAASILFHRPRAKRLVNGNTCLLGQRGIGEASKCFYIQQVLRSTPCLFCNQQIFFGDEHHLFVIESAGDSCSPCRGKFQPLDGHQDVDSVGLNANLKDQFRVGGILRPDPLERGAKSPSALKTCSAFPDEGSAQMSRSLSVTRLRILHYGVRTDNQELNIVFVEFS